MSTTDIVNSSTSDSTMSLSEFLREFDTPSLSDWTGDAQSYNTLNSEQPQAGLVDNQYYNSSAAASSFTPQEVFYPPAERSLNAPSHYYRSTMGESPVFRPMTMEAARASANTPFINPPPPPPPMYYAPMPRTAGTPPSSALSPPPICFFPQPPAPLPHAHDAPAPPRNTQSLLAPGATPILPYKKGGPSVFAKYGMTPPKTLSTLAPEELAHVAARANIFGDVMSGREPPTMSATKRKIMERKARVAASRANGIQKAPKTNVTHGGPRSGNAGASGAAPWSAQAEASSSAGPSAPVELTGFSMLFFCPNSQLCGTPGFPLGLDLKDHLDTHWLCASVAGDGEPLGDCDLLRFVRLLE